MTERSPTFAPVSALDRFVQRLSRRLFGIRKVAEALAARVR
ncbi:hypothetical protein [Notoacmeibacter sp. MSK16QG-6]|nr:hypothetical protein [Notoacmeibacter sp. MSK16QG-6]